MPPLSFSKPQTVLGLLQSAIVVAGSLFVVLGLRIGGGIEGYENDWWPMPLFIRHFGFAFLSIPVAWVISTLWAETHHASWFSSRWTIVSGIGLMVGLACFFFFTGCMAASHLVSQVNEK